MLSAIREGVGEGWRSGRGVSEQNICKNAFFLQKLMTKKCGER
jgi:hypothetical protein